MIQYKFSNLKGIKHSQLDTRNKKGDKTHQVQRYSSGITSQYSKICGRSNFVFSQNFKQVLLFPFLSGSFWCFLNHY